jgi:tricorn protease
MPVSPRSIVFRLLGAACAFAALPALADSPTKLLRFPDVHNDRVTFVYAGDVYVVSVNGGTALRLTSHQGDELYPKFSPDGSQIAFSAEYNGTRQVYVVPSAGGSPRQLTWYNDVGELPPRGGTDNRVLDWSPDGANVLVRMNRAPWDNRSGRPYLVPVNGGLETPLAVPESGGGMFDPTGTKLVYTPIDRDFRSWKRYRGGRAQDVWIYDLAANTSLQLTNDRATDHQPMWIGDAVYFVSDRADAKLNLYAVSPQGGEARKLTTFADFDVMWPSAGPDSIVFEKGGSIWRYLPSSGAATEIPIRVAGDLPQTQPRFVEAADFVESFGLSPNGERAVFGARGEIFTAPAKNGEPRNISMTPEAREIAVSWSPDGKSIAYLSDATGEYEIYLRAQDGKSPPRRLTSDGNIWRFAPVWSPDSKKIAFGDKQQRLRVLDIASGEITDADQGTHDDIDTYTWAPDSRWIAYVKGNASRNTSIWMYSLEAKQARQLTPDETSETSPAFDPDGRYLYFVSNRDYNLTFSAYEFNWLYTNASRIYAATLQADGPALFRPKSDEVALDGETGDDEKSADDDSVKPLRIDIPGFNQRVVALNAPAGNYAGLSANSEGVFYFAPGDGGGSGELRFIGLNADDTLKPVAAVTGYAMSPNGNKLLLRRASKFAIVDAKPNAEFDANALSLSRMELRVEPKIEWRQQFVDGWRLLRDWFYDPGMHGNDWNAIRAKYEALLPHVASRGDLDWLFQEIAGEANAGHVYVERGDQSRVERKAGGLLGAELADHASGYTRIAHIFPGENWNPTLRSPLTEPGVNVAEGDFILAVDNVSTRGVDNFYRLLENRADRVVTLRVNKNPQEAGARDVQVRTLASEQGLRYLDWVQSRRRMVEQLSDGRIGYIHVPNTAVEGSRELFKGMLAYASKEALVIDDRYNGGGFIPDRMIELLSRQPLNYWKQRGLEPNPTPLLNHRGPKAMLINGLSASGGDALPYYFRKMKLGTLFGTRTWGGLIGISGNPRLSDNGGINAATFRFMSTDGGWAVENEGVAPDVEVIDRPELLAAGRDPTLEAAVQHLLRELQANPPSAVTAPAAPTMFPPQ